MDTGARTGHDPVLIQALVALTRAAQDSPEAAVTLILRLLQAEPGRWVTVLAAAQQLGGPHEAALMQAVAGEHIDLPLADLDNAIPLTASQLTALGLLTTQQRVDRKVSTKH